MPTAPQRSSIIRFGEYDIDLQARELRRSGVRLKLSGQPLEVLVLLLEQPG
jgi:DNA-binding response OmpR family regulator